MLRNALMVFVALMVLCSLNACRKKENQEKAVPEKAAPAIIPGEMLLIPAGEFIMGTNSTAPGDWFANPQHKLSLPAFWIDKYEVTNGQYMEFTGKTGYVGEAEKAGKDWRRYFSSAEKELVPVLAITWKDANAYCKSVGKRLPIEEEWEKAARGPNGNKYPWGNEWMDGRSNTDEVGLKNSSAIGQFNDVSFYGVHDMLGNVQEWTESKFAIYKGNPHDEGLSKVLKPGETYHVVRGLSAKYPGEKGNLWSRAGLRSIDIYDTGFRCAKDATPEEAAK
jgi:gamma-glutamyl hercynylcysteine S-oxide synthase